MIPDGGAERFLPFLRRSSMRGATVRKADLMSSHPYIVQTKGVCGGRARIRDTRIPVSTIGEYVRKGESRDNLLFLYSYIDPAAIDDAIDYYLDHREEIDEEIEANSLEAVLAETGAVLGVDGVIHFPKPAR
jgi:uncharacterized protein (DUF433 family)